MNKILPLHWYIRDNKTKNLWEDMKNKKKISNFFIVNQIKLYSTNNDPLQIFPNKKPA